MNTEIAIAILLTLAQQADKIAALIRQARAEGRDITDAELDALASADDQARALLEAEIQKARLGKI